MESSEVQPLPSSRGIMPFSFAESFLVLLCLWVGSGGCLLFL